MDIVFSDFMGVPLFCICATSLSFISWKKGMLLHMHAHTITCGIKLTVHFHSIGDDSLVETFALKRGGQVLG